MLGNNLALIAMACLAVIRWHVHFSRTIFRALLPSAFAVGTLYFLYRWVLFRNRRDAIISGALMGLGFYTYISFRVMPVVVGGWLLWIAWRKLVPWKETFRAFAILYGAAFLVVVPLLLNYAMNPEHVTARTSEITLWNESRTVTTDDGQEITRTVARPIGDVLAELFDNKMKIARMWTIEGDPMARHNVPGMPVFLWPDGILFILGTVWALFVTFMRGNMVRNPAGESGVELDSAPGKWSGYISSPLLVLWLFLFLSASLFSRGAPNILRAQGAVPAVVILLVIGLWVVVRFIRDHRLRWLVIILFTGYFSVTQLQSYFVTFARHPSVKRDFLAEMFYEPAVGVKEVAARYKWVAVPREFAETLTPQFVLNTEDNIVVYDPEDSVSKVYGERDPSDFAWLITSRSEQLADANSQAEQLTSGGAHIEGRTFFITEPRGADQPALRHPWAVMFLPIGN